MGACYSPIMLSDVLSHTLHFLPVLLTSDRDRLQFVAMYMKGLIDLLVCNTILKELSHLEYPTSGNSFQTNCIPVRHATS